MCSNTIKIFFIGFLFLTFTACGYKPSSALIKNVFDDTVYVEVHVDKVEPENAPFIKDEMNRLVYARFKGRVVSKEKAENQILVNYAGSNFYPLVTDENGYITRYRANIRVRFTMKTKKGSFQKSIMARHDGSVQASSLRSSTLRIEAIRKGLEKALDQFLAYVSVEGLKEKKNSKNKKSKKIK